MTIKTYWENLQDGTIYCTDHAGSYLTFAIKDRPRAKTHNTPLGTWAKMTDFDAQEFASEFGECCESCRYSKAG